MAEQWLLNAAAVEARMFRRDLISSGYEVAVARDMSTFVCCLLEDNSTLWTRADKDDKLKLSMGIRSDRPLLQHDERLLPYWNRFTEALSSVAFGKRTCISFSLVKVQMSKNVMDMLLQSLKKVPLDWLYLYNNALGNDGFNCLVELLNTNTSLKSYCIESNPIESDVVAIKLVNAIIDHPNVDDVMLDKCEIGKNNGVMKAVLPLLHLKEVSLDGNHIGSYGAELISDSLATNPTIQKLFLRDNLLNDANAKKLSESLKTNTNLQVLSLAGNLITRDGMVCLLLLVCNINSLNAISDSNHNCLVKIDDGEYSFLSKYFNEVNNTSIRPAYNRQVKIFKALMRNTQECSEKDTPIEAMPRVLALLHNTAFYKLDALFRFMKEWNMPLLYTSRLGKEPRRSKRIRKKMVTEFMGKK